jgi:hypothetical protein
MSKSNAILTYAKEILPALHRSLLYNQETGDDRALDSPTAPPFPPREFHTLRRVLSEHEDIIEPIMNRNVNIYRNFAQLVGLLHTCCQLPDLPARCEMESLFREEYWPTSPCQPPPIDDLVSELEDMIDLFFESLTLESPVMGECLNELV